MSDLDEQADLPAVYGAIVDYHNNLVHMRFTVAGLYLAASGFLVGAMFGESEWNGKKLSVTLLGVILTAIVCLLEMRTSCLLDNLVAKGADIEKKLKLNYTHGFFALMSDSQRILPRWPCTKIYIKGPPKLIRFIISHSFGLNMLYLCFAVFWILMFLFYK